MVPKGWSLHELDALCDKIAVGLAISVTPYMRPSGVKLIRNQNIKRNFFSSDSVVFIDHNFANDNKGKKVKVGDVVAVRTGSNIGEACVVPSEFDGALTFTTLIVRPQKTLLDSFYLSTHINSDMGVSEVNRLCAGGGKPNLNSGELKRYRILTPPLSEQKKIAKILSTWDQAIATTESLISYSQQQKKALMQQLLAGEKRFPGFKGEWKWLRANKIFKTVSKKNNSDGEELLSVTQDQGVLPRSMLERRVVMPDGATSGYKLVVPGNFVISLRSFQGGLEYSCYRGLVSPAYTVLEPIKKICDEFYKQYYKSYEFIGHLAVAVIGIRDGKQINYDDFSFLKLPYPSIEEQQKIASVLSIADREIETLKHKLDYLEKEKKALMQQLLTGKRRVQLNDMVMA